MNVIKEKRNDLWNAEQMNYFDGFYGCRRPSIH